MFTMKSRNQTIDILRTIGLFLVIAAHCSFSSEFYEFREFDVVLLVFCSGASFALSSSKESYWNYVKKRFKKLILPVWLFLCVFFPIHYFIGQPVTLKMILATFLFTSSGLMFVWIFRVLFVNAFCNPWIKKIIEHSKYVFLLGLGIILINDGLHYLVSQVLTGKVLTLYEYIVSYTVGYGVISMYGMHGFFESEKKKSIIAIMSFLIFVGYYLMSNGSSLQVAKYPPMMYYISYGVFWSMMLSVICNHIHLNEKVYAIIKWISIHSMTIYMWHMVFFYLLYDGVITGISDGFAMYIYILSASLASTRIVQIVKSKWRK